MVDTEERDDLGGRKHGRLRVPEPTQWQKNDVITEVMDIDVNEPCERLLVLHGSNYRANEPVPNWSALSCH